MPELNFFDNYYLQAITEEIVHETSFFRDRYFPTGEGDIWTAVPLPFAARRRGLSDAVSGVGRAA